MGVGIQKTLCGGRNTEILIVSTCFYLKVSRVRMLAKSARFAMMNASTIFYETRGFSELNNFSIT